jgi:hypothetical protein
VFPNSGRYRKITKTQADNEAGRARVGELAFDKSDPDRAESRCEIEDSPQAENTASG